MNLAKIDRPIVVKATQGQFVRIGVIKARQFRYWQADHRQFSRGYDISAIHDVRHATFGEVKGSGIKLERWPG